MADTEAACEHPAEEIEFEEGNHVPPYGWEIYPGWYCSCGEMLDDDFARERVGGG